MTTPNPQEEWFVRIPIANKFKKRLFTSINKSDLAVASAIKWHLHTKGYARGYCRKRRKMIYLHVLILGNKEGNVIDHINGDKLDNRKQNLRWITNVQNIVGSKSRRKRRAKGVWKTPSGRWKALITPNGKNVGLGVFDTMKEAALAYNKAAKKFYGKYAYQNRI